MRFGNGPWRIRSSSGLERQVRVDRAGAVAEQQRDVVHFARFAGFDQQAALGARAFAHEMVMHAGGREQAGNRRVLRVDAAIRQDQDAVAGGHRRARLAAQLRHRALEARAILVRVVEQRQRRRSERRTRRQVAKLGHLVVVKHRELDLDLAAGSASGRAGCLRAPMVEPIDVTSSSRIASSGGLVTCANSCLK